MNQREHTVSVKKKDLIKRVIANRDAHIKEYEKALVGFRKKAAIELRKALKKLPKSKSAVTVMLQPPVDQRKQYEKLLAALRWETKDTIELTRSEFNQYVLDETDFAMMARTTNYAYANFSK